MVKVLSTFLSTCIAIIGYTAAFQLSCEETAEDAFTEGIDNTDCFCEGPGNNETTFNWTLFHDSGRSENLAVCYGIGNCTSSYSPPRLQISLATTSSSLFIQNLTSQFSGILTCTQTNRTFNGSSSVRIKVKKIGISSCNPNMLLREVGSSENIACEHSPYIPSTVTWTIYTHSRRLIQLGSCSGSSNNYNCTSLLAPGITLTGDNDYSSIAFQDGFIDRDYAAVISSYTYNSSTESDNCTLTIYNTETVENCNLQISRQNWSFVMYFDVSNAYTTANQYTFQVSESFELLKRDQLLAVEGTTFVGYRSYRQYLKSYINSTNNKLYYRGWVVYSWPMSPYPGKFNSFRIDTSYYGTNAVTYDEGLNFSLPVRPTHNCSGVTTSCSCSTETLGFPAGRLQWLIGNTTVAIGDYGVKELLFPSDNLTDGEDVVIATCELDWIHRLISKEPAVFHIAHSDQYQSLAIAGWTLWSVAIVLNVVFVVIVVRQGNAAGWPWRKPVNKKDDEVVLPHLNR